MSEKRKGVTLVTPKFRVSYPKVFKPEYNKLAKRDEYSVVALFPKGADLEKMKEAALEVGKAMFGPNPKKWPKNFKSPFKDQGEREKENDDGTTALPDGYVKGAVMVQMKSKNKPGLIDQQKNPIEDESEFYAGCWARANVYISAYEIDGGVNRGVSIALNHLQKVADGDPFSGRPKAEEVFEAIEESGDEESEESSSEEDEGNPFG